MLCSMACTVQSTVICPSSMKMPAQKLHFGYNFTLALKIQPGSIFWNEHRNNMRLSNWLCATGCPSPLPPTPLCCCCCLFVCLLLLLWGVVVRRRNLPTLPLPSEYYLSSSSLSYEVQPVQLFTLLWSTTCPALHSPLECHLSSPSLSFRVSPVQPFTLLHSAVPPVQPFTFLHSTTCLAFHSPP